MRVPTFAYWKGTIAPRRSEGLFDFADFLPTVMSLAGVPGAKVAEHFPKTTYIDGVDQASFLVADRGQSARRSRPYTLNQYLASMRIDEFKYTWTTEIENAVVQRGNWGGFSGATVTDTGGAICFNLYTNPQEDVSIGPAPPSHVRRGRGRGGLVRPGAHQVPAAVQGRVPEQQPARLRRPPEAEGAGQREAARRPVSGGSVRPGPEKPFPEIPVHAAGD